MYRGSKVYEPVPKPNISKNLELGRLKNETDDALQKRNDDILFFLVKMSNIFVFLGDVDSTIKNEEGGDWKKLTKNDWQNLINRLTISIVQPIGVHEPSISLRNGALALYALLIKFKFEKDDNVLLNGDFLLERLTFLMYIFYNPITLTSLDLTITLRDLKKCAILILDLFPDFVNPKSVTFEYVKKMYFFIDKRLDSLYEYAPFMDIFKKFIDVVLTKKIDSLFATRDDEIQTLKGLLIKPTVETNITQVLKNNANDIRMKLQEVEHFAPRNNNLQRSPLEAFLLTGKVERFLIGF